eukprot:311175-Chlamydomonas_euryale.AAC.2
MANEHSGSIFDSLLHPRPCLLPCLLCIERTSAPAALQPKHRRRREWKLWKAYAHSAKYSYGTVLSLTTSHATSSNEPAVHDNAAPSRSALSMHALAVGVLIAGKKVPASVKRSNLLA